MRYLLYLAALTLSSNAFGSTTDGTAVVLAQAQVGSGASGGPTRSFPTDRRYGVEGARPQGVIVEGAHPGDVVLYCTSVNAACKNARAYLQSRNIAFVDKDLNADPNAVKEYDALGGQGVPMVAMEGGVLYGFSNGSFDRFYAKAAVQSPVDARSAGVRPVEARPPAAFSAPLPAHDVAASPVEVVGADAIAEYLNKYPVVVVQFTSPDRNCGFCGESYSAFDVVAAVYGSKARFARVEWTPWQNFPPGINKLIGYAIPTQIVFKNGKQSGRFAGTLRPQASKFNTWLETQIGSAR